jgi:hypothetical protein
VEQELFTLSEHLSSPPVFSRVRVAQSLVFVDMFVDRWFFSFGHCNVPSSIPFSDYPFFLCSNFSYRYGTFKPLYISFKAFISIVKKQNNTVISLAFVTSMNFILIRLSENVVINI